MVVVKDDPATAKTELAPKTVPAKKKTAPKMVTAKVQKLPQKPEVEGTAKNENGVTAKNDFDDFAGDDFFAGDGEEDGAELDFFAGVDDDQWRLEKRTYVKKDGTEMVYYNYRARRSYVNKNGRRVVPYRKGGKRIKQNG